LLSARVFFRDQYGPEFDHLLILVECEGELLISDVGFGNSFREPLFLNDKAVKQLDAFYKIECNGYEYTLLQKRENMMWQIQYIFTLENHKIEACRFMCEAMPTSVESHFTQETICSIATKSGRKTLSNNRYIETTNGKRNEFIITNEEHYRKIVKQHFSISLPNHISLECWENLGLKLS
jgi:N-hydroxyarylamine O-acetyltransferase